MDSEGARPSPGLAQLSAQTLVSAMTSDSWKSTSTRIAAVIGMKRHMTADRRRLIELVTTAEIEKEQDALCAAWQVRISHLLDKHPELAAPLQTALGLTPESAAGVAQSASASDSATVVQSAGDVTLNAPEHTLASAGIGAAAGAATMYAANLATSVSAGKGVSAAGVTTMTVKTVVITVVIAGATAAGTGYAAYEHYTCGSAFGDRTAIEVVSTAAHRIKDSSFRFSFRLGNLARGTGQADNREPAGEFQASAGTGTIYYVIKGLDEYMKLPDGEWQHITGTANTDPLLSQGNPIKAAEYLPAAGNTEQSGCSINGTLDLGAFDPALSGEQRQFQAAVDPAGNLTHLQFSLAPELGEIEMRLYDHGAPVNIEPPVR